MKTQDISVMYYETSELSTELKVAYLNVIVGQRERPVIPESFKINKLVVAVCKGHIELINKLGDRPSPMPVFLSEKQSEQYAS